MATNAHEEHGHHIADTRHLLATLLKLTVLMVLTIVAARYLHIPWLWFANIVAMTIAVVKACFVIAIFMGVRYTTNLGKLFAIGGFVWFLLLFGILVDYWSRPWEPVQGWEPEASTSLPRTPDRDE